MNTNEKKLADILITEGYLTEEDIQKATQFEESHNTSFTDYLFSEQLITKDLLGQAVAEFFGVSYANIESYQPSKEQVTTIPEDVARKHHAVIFENKDNEVIIATDKPDSADIKTEIAPLFPQKTITLAYAPTEDIEGTFIHYREALEARFATIIKQEEKVAPEIIDEILKESIINKASDIHFEPQEKDVTIRFRIDGVLHKAGTIQKEYYENILNRIKVQAQMRIDEHATAQDGAIRSIINDKPLDVRVSIIPTVNGEKINMRLLTSYLQGLSLSAIGLSERDQDMLLAASKKPFGMILVTGPTGAGKSTTLYAVLNLLNTPEVNITTIEDPVEYKMADINQIKVNPARNLTFATGLRSIVRQDPDIILVGEIRDQETAEISVNAALTGHLVLSSFHANNAPTAIPRLLDMGVEPFLLASTLEVIIAQRLVRKICDSCRHSVSISYEELKEKIPNSEAYFENTPSVTLYQGKGCANCNFSGYKGRTSIFEFMPITKGFQDLILKNPSTKQLWDYAKTQGAHSLFDDGIEKVKQGITTLDELIRVAPPDQDEV